MNLAAAYNIYKVSGPVNPKVGDRSTKAQATQLVHAHLTEAEIQGLSHAWARGKTTKAAFLKKLETVKDRLISEGKL